MAIQVFKNKPKVAWLPWQHTWGLISGTELFWMEKTYKVKPHSSNSKLQAVLKICGELGEGAQRDPLAWIGLTVDIAHKCKALYSVLVSEHECLAWPGILCQLDCEYIVRYCVLVQWHSGWSLSAGHYWAAWSTSSVSQVCEVGKSVLGFEDFCNFLGFEKKIKQLLYTLPLHAQRLTKFYGRSVGSVD